MSDMWTDTLKRATIWLLIATVSLNLLIAILGRLTKYKVGRLGWFSFRNIGLPELNGVSIEIVSVGFTFHRPTHTTPTWVTLLIQDTTITIDTNKIERSREKTSPNTSSNSAEDVLHRIGRITRKSFFRYIDFKATDTRIVALNAGCLQLGSLTAQVHSRNANVRTNSLNKPGSAHRPKDSLDQRHQHEVKGLQASLQCTEVSFSAHGNLPTELLDFIVVDASAEYSDKYGLANIALALKLGSLVVLDEDVVKFIQQIQARSTKPPMETSQSSGLNEDTNATSTTKSDDLLDIVTELQVHIGFIKTSYTVDDVTPGGLPVTMIASSKDVVIDINRLHEESPDFRMLFAPGSSAHQGLVSAISISLEMDSQGRSSQVLAIPMSTIAIKSNSISHALRHMRGSHLAPQTNITNISTVITSPAIDVHSDQIGTIIAMCRPRVKSSERSRSRRSIRASELPTINFSFSAHDPSVRVVLDDIAKTALPPMIIGRLSSVSLDAHGLRAEENYKLDLLLRASTCRLYYQSPSNQEFSIMRTDDTTLDLSMGTLPLSQCRATCSVNGLILELLKPEIVDCIAKISNSMQSPKVLPAKLPKPIKAPKHASILEQVPAWLDFASLQLRNFSVLVAGVDKEVAQDVRGIKISFNEIYFYVNKAEGTAIEHGRDIRTFVDDGMATLPDFLNSSVSRTAVLILQRMSSLSLDAEGVFNNAEPILELPSASAAIFEYSHKERASLHLVVKIEEILLGYSLFKVYAILQGLQILRRAFAIGSSQVVQNDIVPEPHERVMPHFTTDAKITLIRLKTRLPLDCVQMVDLERLHITKHLARDISIHLHYARVYVDSKPHPGSWDRILSIREISLSRETHTEKSQGQIVASKAYVIRTDALRVRIPHQFIFYEMLEGIINSAKTTVQIVHRFVTRTNDYIIAQHPKKPKHLPRIRLKSKAFTVDLEDDPFEARLALIYRVGLSEQRMRESRDAAFDRKVTQLQNEDGATASVRSATNASHDISLSRHSSTESSATSHRPKLSEDYSVERQKLLEHNSHAWISRMRFALDFRQKTIAEMRQLRWGKDDVSDIARRGESILSMPDRPPLFSLHFVGVDLIVDHPSFDLELLPDFIHRVGRGMPKDSQYGLLIPMSINWKMEEARVQLRDYPLPLLHVPPLHTTQRQKMRSWEFRTDLVIGEEFPELEAIRHVDVCVIPADTGRRGSPAFSVEVQRTAGAVKTYAEITVDLNSSLPTQVHWGSSVQPAISDVARIFDSLTKPQQDPSPKLGFWDKIGLVMHTSIKLNFLHDGDMHVTIKGSRDPYVVMGAGAGLTKVFRGDVRWQIGCSERPSQLIDVKCHEYMLAIPDFSRRTSDVDQPRAKPNAKAGEGPLHFYHLSRKEIAFQKILMKLTGDVHWVAGLTFERRCDIKSCSHCKDEARCRLWTFKPHWEIKMRIPEYSILPGGQLRDAFEGYRSDFVHGHISVTSQCRQDESKEESYNTMHLSPKAFAHFFDWIHSFSGNLSLPIRTGALFPSAEGPKQKFGQYLRTLKYNLTLKPLFLSHIYRTVDPHDISKVDVIGVKAKIGSFVLDLHQRKEERVITNKELETQRKSSHMSIYRGQVDLQDTDLRALTAIFDGDVDHANINGVQRKDPLDPEDDPRFEHAAKQGEFDVAGEDVRWIDMDDFVELDAVLPVKSPKCRIIPLAYSPRFTYDRDTTPKEGSQDEHGKTKVTIQGQQFGFEKTHRCSMITADGKDINDDFGYVQRELWDERLKFLQKEVIQSNEHIEETSMALKKAPNSRALNEQLGHWKEHGEMLKYRLKLLEKLLSDSARVLRAEHENSIFSPESGLDQAKAMSGEQVMDHIKKEVMSFNNRFLVHNIQLKWNNTLRNILIRYVQQVNQRRGFSYYMSQKAIRFLNDLVDDQLRNKSADDGAASDVLNDDYKDGKVTHDTDLNPEMEKLLKHLLNDREQHFFVPDETVPREDQEEHTTESHAKINSSPQLHENYAAHNNYLFSLLNPQIQLQSEKNASSAVVLAAASMTLRILAINDKTVAEDDVSALVQRDFHLRMTGAQFFYAEESRFHGAVASLLTQNCYGAQGDSYWPPWIPIESVFDFERSPRAFDRIVDKTSISAQYIKHNSLRIKKNERAEQSAFKSDQTEDRTDSIAVHFPKFNLSANSEQYYAMFTIAMDLLLYSEPLQKQRNEQIEKILLSADFSDLSGAPEMVSLLQKRIRLLNDFKTQFKQHSQRNDPQCKKDEQDVEKKLGAYEDELFFLMKSIATAQQKQEDRDSEVVAAMQWRLEADEILWHLVDGNKAFIDFGLSQASFSRTDNSDSSNYNTLEIEMMQGINLSPKPVFSDLFAPYFGSDRTVVDARRSKMVRVYWYMLEAIGGISVCDHFEVNLFPLRIQMEHELGKKIFAYVFPDKVENKPNADESTSSSDVDSASESSDDDGISSIDSRSSPRYPSGESGMLSLDSLRHPSQLTRRLGHKLSRSRLRPDAASVDSKESDTQSTSGAMNSTVSLNRTYTNATVATKATKGESKKEASADDLTAMLSRASQNMSLVYVKVPSVVLALSYKGAKAKNFTDVTDFVFKMPTIEYRNKTWSYLDLAEHLKREVIKAVLAHTGSLLRDKITHRRSARRHQPTLARQLTSYKSFVPAEQGERRITEIVDERHQLESDPGGPIALQNRTSTAETSSLQEPSHGSGLFNNAIGRHIQHLSHIARHKDGIADDNDESTLKKTRLLLGKFIDKAR